MRRDVRVAGRAWRGRTGWCGGWRKEKRAKVRRVVSSEVTNEKNLKFDERSINSSNARSPRLAINYYSSNLLCKIMNQVQLPRMSKAKTGFASVS